MFGFSFKIGFCFLFFVFLHGWEVEEEVARTEGQFEGPGDTWDRNT